MKLLDGTFIENTSPGGHLWQRIESGQQTIVLEATRGQDILDLKDVAEEQGILQKVGAWLGSLSLSTSKGLPDDYSLDIGDVRDAIYGLQESLMKARCVLPILVDVDACYGNPLRAFAMLNVLQVALGITENKKADVVKVNSLVSGKEDREQMAPVGEMLYRLRQAKSVQKNTLVGARLENLIYGFSPEETIEIMQELQSACDVFLIHWNKSDPKQLLNTAKLYQQRGRDQRPLVAVTTTYGKEMTPAELHQAGFSILIYPNQVVRHNLQTSRQIYSSLLQHPSAGGAMDEKIPPTKEVIQRFAQEGTLTQQRIL